MGDPITALLRRFAKVQHGRVFRRRRDDVSFVGVCRQSRTDCSVVAFRGARREHHFISDLSNQGSSDLLNWLGGGNNNWGSVGIDKYQFAEEKRKAELILKDPSWEKWIEDVENHVFFRGQIGFLLDMADKDGNGPNIDAFRAYSALAKVIFDPGHHLLDKPDFLLERALLSTSSPTERDYLVQMNSSFSFLKGEEWKKEIFRDPEKRQLLKRLLDALLPGGFELDQVRTSLNTVIDAAKSKVQDWRRYFITCPGAIGYCGERKIRWENDGHDILLLSKTSLKGWHAELRSFCLMEELNKKSTRLGFPKWEYRYRSRLEEPFPHTYLSIEGTYISISHPPNPQDSKMPFEIEVSKDAETKHFGCTDECAVFAAVDSLFLGARHHA